MKSVVILLAISLLASLALVGCSNPEPEIDPNVPMGKDTDKFKPMQLQAAGSAPKKEEAKGGDSKEAPKKEDATSKNGPAGESKGK